MKCRFLISRVTKYFPRIREKTRVVFIDAPTFAEARDQIVRDYPEWSINMAWPVWPETEKGINND